ncbi:MAG TPA: FIST N-terminal domain-containing protein [Leptolyngbya sp.]|jgi:hypothetical protein|nr:FIST N-terminal domain-containing protein [Leptolyngbya sp.]
MLKAIVGHSNDPDSADAIAEVIAQCQAKLNGFIPTAGLLFTAIDFDYALILQAIDRAFPNLELIGCTSDAEMSDTLQFQQDSVILTLFCSEGIEIRAGVGRNVSQGAIAAAQSAIDQAHGDQPARFCITVPEGLSTSCSAILNGLQTVLGKRFPIFGGMATDDYRFEATYQFYKTEVLKDAVPILLFSGEGLKFSHGISSGWQPISRAGTVTKAVENAIFTIDDQAALPFYQDQLGGLAPVPEHPLAVFEPEDASFYLRGCRPDSADGVLLCLGDVPEGAIVQVSTASRDDILAASKTAILQAIQTYPGDHPSIALIFSCDCRFKILGSRVREEYDLIRSCLPESVSCSGFYTYGELSPLSEFGITRLHNHTIITLLLGT